MIVFVDWFDDVPVTVDVQPLGRTFIGQTDSLRRTVIVAHLTAEDRSYLLACGSGEGFARGVQDGCGACQPAALASASNARGYPPSITG